MAALTLAINMVETDVVGMLRMSTKSGNWLIFLFVLSGSMVGVEGITTEPINALVVAL